MAIATTPNVGRLSKYISQNNYPKPNESTKADYKKASEVFGNGVIGNAAFGMKGII